MFEDNFPIVQGGSEGGLGALELPSETTWKGFMTWVNDLPEREPPTYLGLPANAEKLLLVAHAEDMLRGMKKVMDVLDEGESVMAEVE
jgi:dynein heavy chain 1